jgi:hypothetical protein
MVEILQTYKYMSEPAHLLEALVKGKRVGTTGTACSAGTWRTARSSRTTRGASGR